MTDFVTLNGHTYSDGNNDGGIGIRYLGNGGHRVNFLNLIADVVAIVGTQGMAVSPTANLTVNSLTATAGLSVSGSATVSGYGVWHLGNLPNPITGSGTGGYLPRLTAGSVIANSQIQDNGVNIGINAVPQAAVGIFTNKVISGGSTATLASYTGLVQSDVTTVAYGVATSISTVAAAFTAGNIRHFMASQGALGVGSSVTNQVGFYVSPSLSGAASNIGFFSSIAAGVSNNWNFYAGGNAPNYFNGSVGIGLAPGALLHVKGGSAAANTAPIKLTAGINLTTAEPGAVEYDGSRLFLTLSDAVRRRVNLSNDVAQVSAIAVGVSPFTFQNTTDFPVIVLISNGTVSLTEYTRNNTDFYTIATSTAQPVQVMLSPNDRVRVTYSVAPTMSCIPL